MNKRISMVAAAATLAVMPLLVACGSSGSAPASSSAPATTQAASTDPSSTAASSAAATPTTATSSASATPTADPSQDSGDVKAATEKFVKVALTIGYPDKNFDVYLKRLKPLMTTSGYAEAQKTYKSKADLGKSYKTLYSRHGRISPKLDSAAKVTSISADKARSSVKYQIKTQVYTGGKWKTLQTSAKDTATTQLVKEGGKWLVAGF